MKCVIKCAMLMQVCCGLSILCLVVVAVSIGYKSETHYRLEEPSRYQETRDICVTLV